MNKTRLTAFCLLALLLTQAAFPTVIQAYTDMTTSSAGLELIERYESFSPAMYSDGGRWYVGYGTQVEAGAYPNGVTEAEAEALLRTELGTVEMALNAFFTRYGLSPTQAQFDALASFSYNLGTAWLSGSSDLVKIVRGDLSASRRETARAFGVWSHSGGAVLPGLAARRLEEAALYLDGVTTARDEFAYLAVTREDGVTYATDFAVYERGDAYDAFPLMIRLGYTLSGLRNRSGRTIHLGDSVAQSESVTAVWEKNVYQKRAYDDVASGAWYYDYIMELSEAGVINGRTAKIYEPDSSVTVGEALKLVLLAVGIEQQPATARHWASGYAQYARSLSYLPDSLLEDLDRPISRLDAAHLAAKALGFGQSFAESPFADVDDGYVTALSEFGILTGMTEQSETVYHPEGSFTRAQAATIVWRLRNAVALGTKQTVQYGSRSLEVASGVPFNSYDRNSFSGSGLTMAYSEPGVTVKRGIDVSSWQGNIDWAAVKAEGIDFAILRAGYRGYTAGKLQQDEYFESNYAGASAAGITIGVYFFSQAVNAAEAVEEADYVLELIRDKKIDGPVVFDWETVGSSDARTNGLPSSVVSGCAIAYCERVKAAGHTPMIYMNTYDGYIRYDLSRLADYDIWYAGQYNGDAPTFFYNFQIWQYTSSGVLGGVDGQVDMDLWFLR